MGMFRSVTALFRAQWQNQWAGGAWPVAPLLVHGAISALLCALVSTLLVPQAYLIFALGLSAALLLLALMGDYAPLFAEDEALEWIETQPVSQLERRSARLALMLSLVGLLSLASLLPAAALLPDGDWRGRTQLVGLGLGQALLLSAGVLALTNGLQGKARALLLLLQTLLVSLAVVGLILSPGLARLLRETAGDPGGVLDGWARWLTPVAFVRTPELAWLAALLALVIVILVPSGAARDSTGARGPLDLFVQPLRGLIARLWVRRAERASYEFVLDALPREREFVLRTYPMLGIPLALLYAGSGEARSQEALLTLLLFAPPVYLPVLLVHVPGSKSHAARWIFDSSPSAIADLHHGARKALALRFVLPLYVLLAVIAAWMAGPGFALRVAPLALLTTLLFLKPLYAKLVSDLPLSVAPDRILARMDWAGLLMLVAMLLVGIATATQLLVRTPLHALIALVILLFLLAAQERRGDK
jgi:hypothetical protein